MPRRGHRARRQDASRSTRTVTLVGGRQPRRDPAERSPIRKRWQPVGYGAQPLYTVTATLDRRSRRRATARRSAHRPAHGRADPQGRQRSGSASTASPIFAKGANLIPFDSFPARVTPAPDAHRPGRRARRQHEHDPRLGRRLLSRRRVLRHRRPDGPDGVAGLHVRRRRHAARRRLPRERPDRGRGTGRRGSQAHPSIVLWSGDNEVLSGWENWSDRKAFKKAVGADEQERIGVGMAVLFDRVLRDAVERARSRHALLAGLAVAPITRDQSDTDERWRPAFLGRLVGLASRSSAISTAARASCPNTASSRCPT